VRTEFGFGRSVGGQAHVRDASRSETRITDASYLRAIRYMIRVAQLTQALAHPLPGGRILGESLLPRVREADPFQKTLRSIEGKG